METDRTRARRDSIRKARRMSNWTAAALIVGTGTATVALAHHSLPAAAPVAGAAKQAGGAAASRPGTSGPQVTHSVATTTASGVTVTTTTRTVNGKTVITQTRHVPAQVDN